VNKNLTEAAFYYEKAVVAGYNESIWKLADLYITGYDKNPKNYTKAI
jgi:TPR repeat protein